MLPLIYIIGFCFCLFFSTREYFPPCFGGDKSKYKNCYYVWELPLSWYNSDQTTERDARYNPCGNSKSSI